MNIITAGPGDIRKDASEVGKISKYILGVYYEEGTSQVQDREAVWY